MISPKPALLFIAILFTLGALGTAETCPEGLTKCVENNVSNEYKVCIGGVFYQYKCPAALVCQDFPASIWYGNTPTNVLCAARPIGAKPAASSETSETSEIATPSSSTTKQLETGKKMRFHANTSSRKWRKTTPTSTYTEPETTEKKKYKPTYTKKPEVTTTKVYKPTPTQKPTKTSGGGGGGGSGEFSGEGTYYDVGLGSCGDVNSNGEMVAALNAPQMQNGPNPNHNPTCGRKAVVHGPLGSVTVTIVDTCPPCKWGDVDLSPSAFDKIAKREQGRVPISWSWA